MSENGFEVYHPQSNTWQNLPSRNVGRGTQLVSLNGKLLAIGGGRRNDKSKASKLVTEFDTTNNSWQELPDMEVPRMWHRAVVVNLHSVKRFAQECSTETNRKKIKN